VLDAPNRAGRRHPERQAYGSRADVAAYLDIPVKTLEKWAHFSKGPAYVRIGRHTRYRWADVEAWIAAQQQGGAQTA
jgi:excisionase family DNA binding protein